MTPQEREKLVLETLEALCVRMVKAEYAPEATAWQERRDKIRALLAAQDEAEQEDVGLREAIKQLNAEQQAGEQIPCKYPDCDCDPIAYRDPCPAGLYRPEARQQAGEQMERDLEISRAACNALLAEFGKFTGLIAKHGGCEPVEGYEEQWTFLHRDVCERFEALSKAPEPVEQQAGEQQGVISYTEYKKLRDERDALQEQLSELTRLVREWVRVSSLPHATGAPERRELISYAEQLEGDREC